MTWALLATSVLLNGTTHYFTSTGTAPEWALAVAVAVVSPTEPAPCVHLAVGLALEDQQRPPPQGFPMWSRQNGLGLVHRRAHDQRASYHPRSPKRH